MSSQNWDYGPLAAYYDRRADYDASAIVEALAFASLKPGARVVDIGAGTGRLTAHLAAQGFEVTAIEPNAEMRKLGTAKGFGCWMAADGCATSLESGSVSLVTYGSSFNVLPATAAIAEALRVLGGSGHVLIVYNHRDLDDPLQAQIEALIRFHAPGFASGSRRSSPIGSWIDHGCVCDARHVERRFVTTPTVGDFVDGFRAHATLIRQLPSMEAFLRDLGELIRSAADGERVAIPFHTRAWCLRVGQ